MAVQDLYGDSPAALSGAMAMAWMASPAYFLQLQQGMTCHPQARLHERQVHFQEPPSPEHGEHAGGLSRAAPRPRDHGVPVAGHVWRLSRDPNGSRLIQHALEDANGDEERLAIAAELHGHVWQAMRCPHANHVLQKCIMTMRPQDIQFVIDELNERGHAGISKAAQHEYACRVLQRMLEHCRPDQISNLVEELLMDCTTLSRHIYGNYTMQHVLEYGTESQKHRLSAQLMRHAPGFGWDHRARKVLTKALSCASEDDQVALANALIQEPKLLVCMARARHGHVAAQLILKVLEGPDFEEARRQLSEELPSLLGNRYGRKIVGCLSQHTSSGTAHAARHPRQGGA